MTVVYIFLGYILTLRSIIENLLPRHQFCLLYVGNNRIT
uniref:Uncharacterized protein n=1 Tax=Anguilla anguilla TaxID=7936 RepID=A0A0E9RQ46_ANGAN